MLPIISTVLGFAAALWIIGVWRSRRRPESLGFVSEQWLREYRALPIT